MGVLASFLASQTADEKSQRQSESRKVVATLADGKSQRFCDFAATQCEKSQKSRESQPSESENSTINPVTAKDKVYLIEIPKCEGGSALPSPVENEVQVIPLATPATPATLAATPTHSAPSDEARAPLLDSEHLQREANRHNVAAMRDGLTDRFCSCGSLATFAWPDADGREVWRCLDCALVRGKA
jgi:hypothetical protein